LIVPSQAFVAQGFTPAVLDRFDVGHSARLHATVVPLFDDTGEWCIGTLTRSEKPACRECKKCHWPDEPCFRGKILRGELRCRLPPFFPRATYLYNFAEAVRSCEPFLRLVEGEELVWKAWEGGCHAVSSLGTLTDPQADKVAALGKQVWLGFTHPREGEFACGRLRARGVRVQRFPAPWSDRDIASVTAEEVRRWLHGRAGAACGRR
jgi:hypothetical protein